MSSSDAPLPTFRTTPRTFAHDPDLPFADLITADHVRAACDELGIDFANEARHTWTPARTLGTFLTQATSPSKSCVAAVARALVLRVGRGLSPCSENTGAYCQARAKRPVALRSRLATRVGDELERQAGEDWQWKGRRVRLGDGTTVSGPGTPENQAEYPQPNTQKQGLGFPMIRLVVLLGFATGVLVGGAIGPGSGNEVGEMALLRELRDRFQPGDVYVADRAYCSYRLIAALQARGVDVAIRLHQSRHDDFGTGQRLGKDDHVAEWARPARPDGMDKPTYHATPKTLAVREVRFRVDRPGYRTREIIAATTLMDATKYTREEIAELYHDRWRVELSIREVKQTLGMGVRRGKTPEMLRREIWCHLLAYNLVRQVIAQSARAREVSPRGIRFAGAMQTLDAFRVTLQVGDRESWVGQVEALLWAIGGHRVGKRPDRCEPREVKRRPKSYPLMTRPRATRQAELMTATDQPVS